MSTRFVALLIASLLIFRAIADGAPAAVQKPQKPSQEQIKALIERTKANLIAMKGGSFDMGDWGLPNGLPIDANMDSKPMHKVTLDPFAMLKYKVTYEEFDTFTDEVGEPRIDNDDLSKKLFRHPNYPASVSWYGANDYCRWLAKKTGMQFNLPTEAQWEYAARSGGTKKYLYSTDDGKIESGRNFPEELERSIYPVGSRFPANPSGLFGMSEWTNEWVRDWYSRNYYSMSPATNPTGPINGTEKVVRGANGSADTTALVIARFHSKPKADPFLEKPERLQFDTRYSDLVGYSAFRCVTN